MWCEPRPLLALVRRRGRLLLAVLAQVLLALGVRLLLRADQVAKGALEHVAKLPRGDSSASTIMPIPIPGQQ